MGIRYQREGLGDFLYPSMAPDSHSHWGHCPEGSVGHFKLAKPKRSPGVPGHWGRPPCRTLPLGALCSRFLPSVMGSASPGPWGKPAPDPGALQRERKVQGPVEKLTVLGWSCLCGQSQSLRFPLASATRVPQKPPGRNVLCCVGHGAGGPGLLDPGSTRRQRQ